MKRYTHTLFLISFLFLFFSIQAEEYNFRRYTNKSGLSHNTVLCSFQDKNGYMWFGTEEGLNRFDGYTFQVYKNDPQDIHSLPHNSIQYIFEDSEGKLWVCTSGGCCYFDSSKEIFERTFAPFENEPVPFFSSIYEDTDHNLWFIRHNLIMRYSLPDKSIREYPSDTFFEGWNMSYTDKRYPFFSDNRSLYFWQKESDTFTKIPIIQEENTYITAICEIPEIGVLIGTVSEGALLYRYHNSQLEEIVPQTQVRCITPYNRNTYWVGTESGVYIYDAVNRTIQNLTKSLTNEYTISDNAIYSITKDMEGGMWVGCFFGGLSYLAREYTSFTSYIGGKTHAGLLGNAIREICPDQYGNLWIGTEDNGINKYIPSTGTFSNFSYNNPSSPLSATNIHGLYAEENNLWIGTYNKGIEIMDIPSGKIIERYTMKNTNGGLPTDFILCFYKTTNNTFLVGTSVGVIEFDIQTKTFKRWQHIHSLVRQIYEDKKGNIWVVTIHGVYRYDPESDQQINYFTDENETNLGSNNITSIFEDSQERIWLTTSNGLSLYDGMSDSFIRVFPKQAFRSTILYRIQEDEKKNLWISSANGLICFNPENYDCHIYSYTEGLHESQFNYSSSYKSPTGELFFGTINGLLSFNPSLFKTDTFVPPLYIHPVNITNPEQVKDGKIRLPYGHSALTLSYSAISFTAPRAIRYAYQLDGIDKGWTIVNTKREVTFANLAPGNYVFKVKSTNSSGIWQENIATFPITITPPFWATSWAYLTYIFLISILIYIFYQYKKARLEKEHQRSREIFEITKEKELYDAKIQFFTYITHEIRTPLTLIKAPLEKIIHSNDGSTQTRDYLNIVHKNTQRLLDLSNQLLDFRRTETKGFQLNFVKTDILVWVENILTRFYTSFEEKNKHFTFIKPSYPVEASIDREAFAKIMGNLLTNAFKYSENKICLEIKIIDSQLQLTVSNDGLLIPKEEQKNIFTPFFRLKENETTPGSGIGLALVHSLVELHEGNISYSSRDNLNHFILTFPLKQIKSLQLEEDFNEQKQADRQITDTEKTQTPVILVVEDQPDMCNFIARELSEEFRIQTAENGEKALEILKNQPIHIILSDIMMPVMDGYELCNEVKNNIHFSHIPIILLTAQHTLQSRLKGLNQGADAYIEKPFSLELLVSQIKNLLKNRDLLKSSYIEKPHVQSSSLALSRMDELFLDKLNLFIDENIANENLTVDMIAEEMNMSTSSLYRKVKGVSGISPVEFIRITRLKKAVQLIQKGEFRINEIAFMTGFSSPAYFSTCFQKQYGKSPSEFLREIS